MPSPGQDLRKCLTHSQDSSCCRFPDHIVIYGIMSLRKGRFGKDGVFNNPWLSHRSRMEAGPFIGMSNISNLYHSATIMSCATVIATNSLPNEDDLMVFCFFECHTIGVFCKKMRILVWDLGKILSSIL